MKVLRTYFKKHKLKKSGSFTKTHEFLDLPPETPIADAVARISRLHGSYEDGSWRAMGGFATGFSHKVMDQPEKREDGPTAAQETATEGQLFSGVAMFAAQSRKPCPKCGLPMERVGLSLLGCPKCNP